MAEQRDALLPAYKEIYAAYGVDWAANTRHFADDYVFHNAGTARMPGFPADVFGIDGYVEGHQQVIEMVGQITVDIEDLQPLGDGRLVVLTRIDMPGGLSQQLLELHQWQHGKLQHQTLWFDREEGRRELGL